MPRVTSAEEPSDRTREKEAQKIQKYRALVDEFNGRVAAEEDKPTAGETRKDEPPAPSAEYAALSTWDLTTKLLAWNPEYYTVWNHRRRLLIASLSTSSTPEVSAALQADLRFLLPLLIKFPKCYWIWNHRLWLLEQATARLPPVDARAFWLDELRLVGQMLARDGRNFHGWGYRRTVVAALESEALAVESEGGEGERKRESRTQQEFDYTTKMTRTNLSNFSAWHNRSKLIPRLLTERGADAAARKDMLDEGAKPLSEYRRCARQSRLTRDRRIDAHTRSTLHGPLRPIHLVLPLFPDHGFLGRPFSIQRLYRARLVNCRARSLPGRTGGHGARAA